MRTAAAVFNGFLVSLLLLLGCGCQTGKDKEITLIRLFRTLGPSTSEISRAVKVYRASPHLVYVDRTPFLNETNLRKAEVVDHMDSFYIQLTFDEHGRFVLESTTAATKDRSIAIQAFFGEERWLGAPVYNRAITDGIVTFTPDASRAEAERIVRGLNAVAKVRNPRKR